ncbi:MAG: aminotransferase class V-fold PLP-dependent enzyme [bacterium]|nr:aminotransferase class V-fold PLP-dependent enzyme [bacterium]
MKKNNGKKRALCGICPAGCWVEVSYDDSGRMSDVQADSQSHLGMICKLGAHSADIVYSKDRLMYPMRRKGKKGNYDFERISWEDAYTIIVDKLNAIKSEHGARATSIYTGRGSFELSMCDVFQPKGVAVSSASSVLFPFGSPNTMGVGALCYVSFAMIAPHVTMGGMLMNMFSEIENAQLIVVWGANPATDCPPLDYNRIIQAHGKGAQIVVIDPRKTMLAKLDNARWIPVRPGTDGALALGLCNVIIEEELYDNDFVEQWTHGFDDFVRYVQHFRPETVEKITGVPADTISSLAREIVSANGASPVMYTGLEYSNSGVQAIRATQVLWALAGQMDVPGGRCFSMRENTFPVNRDGLVPNPDLTNALGRDRFPVYSAYRGESHAVSLPDAVLRGNPYHIRSTIILGGSMITSWPEPKVWKETLNALDFLVCIDRQLTADAAYADIVLPATTMYEIESYMTYGPVFRIRERVVEPVGESRNDFFILAELAKRLGYGHLYPQTHDELLDYVLKGSGFSPAEVREQGGTVMIPAKIMMYKKWEKGGLRADGKPGFDTPTGKFEIHSTLLEEHGYDPLPVYTEPKEGPMASPDLAKRFPLVFNSGGRVTTDFRSQHHGVPRLYKERPDPTVTINHLDAEERDIQQGDLVRVITARGQVTMRALVTEDIVRNAIDANMGGGGPVGPKAWQDCNINELTDLDNYDPISGFPVYKTLLCDVVKVAKGEGVHVDSGEYEAAAHTKPAQPTVRKRIYLDHNATTPLAKEVRETMGRYMEDGFGNPSSIYHEGKQSQLDVEAARRNVARLLNCTARRVVFTGGGSEANNFAIKSVALANKSNRNHIVTSSVEHPSVLNTCKWLEKEGFPVTYLDVDRYGQIHPGDLLKAITPKTCLVSLMLANNEVGTIQPIKELAAVAREHDILFHTDATQAVGKIPVDVEELNVDLLTLSGHKLYAPKGIGALFIRKNIHLDPLVHGGHQEGGLRAGTENVLGIVGFGKAAEMAIQRLPKAEKLKLLRNRLEQGIREIVPKVKINGHPTDRLPNTLNLTMPGMRGESIVLALDHKGIALSSGSACRSGSPEPSHALLAMGLSEEDAHCALRFSLGLGTQVEDIQYTLQSLKEVIEESRTSVQFVPCR